MISVGNLSLGGRGKTPVVARLARWLVEAGERPAILTRGYARREPEPGVVVVSDGRRLLADVDRAGDEPMMLARELPGVRVLVSDQRVLAGALAERTLDATVHILDDGFQHLQLARDIDLVLVSADDCTDRPLPFGRLREPVSALDAADAVIADFGPAEAGRHDSGRAPETDVAAGFSRPLSWFSLVRSLGDPVPLDPSRPWTAPDRRVVAVAGIARPERFRESLEAAGWHVAELLGFRDHYDYTPSDMRRIGAAAERHGVPVVTTAKDAMRLLRLRPLPVAIAAVPLQVEIEPAESFRMWLFDRLRKAREARA